MFERLRNFCGFASQRDDFRYVVCTRQYVSTIASGLGQMKRWYAYRTALF